MGLNPLSFIGDIVNKISDKIAPDKGAVLEAQARINEQESASSGPGLLKMWRGLVGWILGLVLAWECIMRPLMVCYFPNVPIPESNLEAIYKLLMGMLGLSL